MVVFVFVLLFPFVAATFMSNSSNCSTYQHGVCTNIERIQGCCAPLGGKQSQYECCSHFLPTCCAMSSSKNVQYSCCPPGSQCCDQNDPQCCLGCSLCLSGQTCTLTGACQVSSNWIPFLSFFGLIIIAYIIGLVLFLCKYKGLATFFLPPFTEVISDFFLCGFKS